MGSHNNTQILSLLRIACPWEVYRPCKVLGSYDYHNSLLTEMGQVLVPGTASHRPTGG
jgi:hypothetical protein